ncbi:MAG: hypothetical protein QM790_07335 [Nibricoccus sp.]
MSAHDFTSFDGETVLVRSTSDSRNPPTAIRGTFRVKTTALGEKTASVLIDFPEMFTAPAHQAIIPLDISALESLTRNPHSGQLECTVNHDFEREARDRSPVSPQARGGERQPEI